MIDYKELLRKYILWVRSCEGVDFVTNGNAGCPGPSEEDFTAAEWEELEKIAKS